MATREQIGFIRNARAGKATAQLLLGKYYLFGGAGLQKNVATALYWLHRAALRDVEEAWLLIGTHVPFDIAMRAPDPMQLSTWYERAYESGVVQAGLVWARLLLARPGSMTEAGLHCRILTALEAAANAGIVDAQWLLAQELKKASRAAYEQEAAPAASTGMTRSGKAIEKGALEWAMRAAANGVLQAQHALADRAWSLQDRPAFLQWSTPVAQAIAQRSSGRGAAALSEKEATLLTRYARARAETQDVDADDIERCWELAANAGDKDAQFSLGLWYANIDERDNRLVRSTRKSSYKKAIHWLTAAGEQGMAKAWYALHHVYVRPNTGLTEHSADRKSVV